MKIAVFERGLLVSCVLSVGIFAQAASAQDLSQNAGALNGIVTSSHTGFGSGPIMVSLMGSPELGAPIRGLETPPVPSAPVRDVATVSSSSGDTGMAAADTGKNIAFAR